MNLKNILIIVIGILASIFIIGLFKDHGTKNVKDIQIKIDTLIVVKDSIKYEYIKEKMLIKKWDTLYIGGKDTICDSLVFHLRNGIEKCDTIINVQDTIIKLQDKIITIKAKQNLFNTVIGGGVGYTPHGVQPFIGITFGIKIK